MPKQIYKSSRWRQLKYSLQYHWLSFYLKAKRLSSLTYHRVVLPPYWASYHVLCEICGAMIRLYTRIFWLLHRGTVRGYCLLCSAYGVLVRAYYRCVNLYLWFWHHTAFLRKPYHFTDYAIRRYVFGIPFQPAASRGEDGSPSR